jgi:hypothetical protein
MKTIHHALTIATVGFLAGCGVSPSDGAASSENPSIGTSQQSLTTVVDCQKAAGTCVQTAKSLTDIVTCTQKFQACTVQAAQDATSSVTLLKDCRTKSADCLKGALTMSDISACRSVFDSCTADLATTADGALQDAIGAAKDTIDKATSIALDVLSGATSTANTALDAVTACQASADKCITGATSLTTLSGCQDTFETCLGGAVKTVEEAAKLLPLPTPAEIAADFTACQTKATACFAVAFTPTSISACQGTLQTCVKNAVTVTDSTVADLNKLLPPGITVPTPSSALTCTSDAATCLLKPFANPLECATTAVTCITK